MAEIDWGSVLGGAGEVGTALLPYTLTGDQIETLKNLGVSLAEGAADVGTTAAGFAEFEPFTLTSTTGGTVGLTPTEGGGYDLGYNLSDEEQRLVTSMLSGAATAAEGYTPLTAEGLFADIEAVRDPIRERERLAREARAFAQGRTGVRTAAYGGTPEELAAQIALQEQRSKDLLSAYELAPALNKEELENISGMLGLGYKPGQELKSLYEPAVDLSNIATSAGIAESEAMYKSGIAGLEAGAAATRSVAELEAARARALATALAGFFQGGDDSSYNALLDALGLSGTGGSTTDSIVDAVSNGVGDFVGGYT